MDDILGIILLFAIVAFVAVNGVICLAMPGEWFLALISGEYIAFYWWWKNGNH